ncbi:MAG: hypothetical protein R2724_17530 [Bryobacterales bacterium]
MHKAARFFREDVSTEGGYQFRYAADLSFGRSEHASGPTQVSVQRDGTPRVGMASRAWMTQDRFYLDAAKAAAMALVEGQLCSGGWDYIVEFEESKRAHVPLPRRWMRRRRRGRQPDQPGRQHPKPPCD